jgi:hypothetical protein
MPNLLNARFSQREHTKALIDHALSFRSFARVEVNPKVRQGHGELV